MHDSCTFVCILFLGFHWVYGSIYRLGETPLDLTLRFEGYCVFLLVGYHSSRL
jgi:hypothetical protein